MLDPKNQPESENSHEIQIRVRYADTDRMGLVYHSNYFIYFEACRADLIRGLWKSYLQIEQEGYFLVVIEAHCRYRQGAGYDDLLTVRARVHHFTDTRIRFEYQIYKVGSEVLIVEGYTEHCWTDAGGKPCRMPLELKEILTK